MLPLRSVTVTPKVVRSTPARNCWSIRLKADTTVSRVVSGFNRNTATPDPIDSDHAVSAAFAEPAHRPPILAGGYNLRIVRCLAVCHTELVDPAP